MEFCEKVLLLRRARGMTQTEMADLLGVTRQSVYKWERGDSYPEAMTLLAMREVFGLTLDALLDPAYIIHTPENTPPVVTRVGEELTPAADVVVTHIEEIKPAEGAVETSEASEETTAQMRSADSMPDEGDKKKDNAGEDEGNVTDRKRKRGLLSRLFR